MTAAQFPTEHATAPVAGTTYGRPGTSETKSAWKTTELIFYIATVAAVALAALMVGGDNGDDFSAEQALRYITFLTIGYLISRGLAKAGSRSSDHDNR